MRGAFSISDKQTAAMLDKKLDEKTAHTMFICGIVMVSPC